MKCATSFFRQRRYDASECHLAELCLARCARTRHVRAAHSARAESIWPSAGRSNARLREGGQRVNRFFRVILAILSAFIGAAATACDGKNLSRDKAAEIVTREYADQLGRLCQLNGAVATKPEFAALKQEPVCTARVEVTGIRKVSEIESVVEFSVVREPRSPVAKQWLSAFDALASRLGTVRAAHGFSVQHMGMIWQFTDPADGQKFIGLAASGQPEAIRDTPEWKALAGLRQLVAAMVDSGKFVVSEKPHAFRLYDDGWRLEKSQAERDADIQAKQSEASVSNSRGVATAAGPTSSVRGPAVHAPQLTDSVGARRCSTAFSESPASRKRWYQRIVDRVRGRQVPLPESNVRLRPGDRVGPLTILTTGEMCYASSLLANLGGNVVKDSEYLRATLSAPEPHRGYRVLDVSFYGGHAWVLHLDSATVLTDDLLSQHQQLSLTSLGPHAGPGNWAPDASRVVLTMLEGGNVTQPVLMVVALPAGSATLINLSRFLDPLGTWCNPFVGDPPRFRWKSSELLTLDLSIPSAGSTRSSSCPTPGAGIVPIGVDLARGTADMAR